MYYWQFKNKADVYTGVHPGHLNWEIFIHQPVFTEHLGSTRHWTRVDGPTLKPQTGPVHVELAFSLLFLGGREILRSKGQLS